MTKMTKQQAISLKLARWLGLEVIEVNPPQYQNTEPQIVVACAGTRKAVFNPFANSTEGRAQFAECVIKAFENGITAYVKPPTNVPRSVSDSTAISLEAIYYAIDGTADAWGEQG